MSTMMAIGMFVFSLPTLAYNELQRRTDWRHARNPRVGARDATQFVGPGEDTVSLSGTAMAELQDGAASLDTLRQMAAEGDAYPLTDGSGRIWGSFIITNVDERQAVFLADGTPLKIDFGIDLLLVDGNLDQASALSSFWV